MTPEPSVSFEVAGDAYDRFMGRWSRQLSRPFADFAGIGPGMRVLDVGCGTGALTEELLRRVDPVDVAAVDPSASFVSGIRSRLPTVEVQQASAERLPFADAVFDVALAQLVVHLMAEPVAGLAEMARVVRPGGTVAACVWDFAGGRGPLGVFWEAAHSIGVEVHDESSLPGTQDGDLVTLLEMAGLRDVERSEVSATIEQPTFEAWWEPFTLGVGPAGAFVASLSKDERERLRAACEARLTARPIVVETVAWAARGRVPGPS